MGVTPICIENLIQNAKVSYFGRALGSGADQKVGSPLIQKWGSLLFQKWGSLFVKKWGSFFVTKWGSFFVTKWGSLFKTKWGSLAGQAMGAPLHLYTARGGSPSGQTTRARRALDHWAARALQSDTIFSHFFHKELRGPYNAIRQSEKNASFLKKLVKT